MIVSNGIFDSKHLQIVSVIASFDVKGNVQPLYVRIESESLKILDAIKTSASTANCIYMIVMCKTETL